jgi:hypothetical protein
MHSPPVVSAEGDRQSQRESAIASVHTLLMFPQYLGTGITSQPFIRQTYDLCIWLPPPAIPTRCGRSTARRVMSQRCPTRTLFDAQELTNIIVQVTQTCYHPVTNTPDNCIYITGHHKPNYSLHHSRGHTCLHSCTRTSHSSVFFIISHFFLLLFRNYFATFYVNCVEFL